MKEGIKIWLSFTQGERNGVIVLVGIILIQVILLNNMDWFVSETKTDFTRFYAEMEQFEAARKAAAARADSAKAYAASNASIHELEEPPIEYFHFDPNQASASEWKSLGLKDWQYKMIQKYLKKGGSFRQKSDLQKMYSIDDALYDQLEPWIELPESVPSRKAKATKKWKKQPWKKEEKAAVRVAVNAADTNQWRALKGIGPAYARRIVNYRNKLGGFVSDRQLEEVWGLPLEVVDQIAPQLDWDTLSVQQLNINDLPADSLWLHPYISFNLARVIVAYRDMHGPYQQVSDVQNTDLVDANLYRKIAPYLKVN